MTWPESALFNMCFGMLVLACACYAIGRLHQWYRQGRERDEAYRQGYDTATTSLFNVATRVQGALRCPQATVTDITDAPSYARHRAEDLLAPTRRLRNVDGQWSA